MNEMYSLVFQIRNIEFEQTKSFFQKVINGWSIFDNFIFGGSNLRTYFEGTKTCFKLAFCQNQNAKMSKRLSWRYISKSRGFGET